MNRTITVPMLTKPARLDKFLVDQLGSQWSRTTIQKAIEAGQITVNGQRVPVHHFLKAGEIINATIAEPAATPKILPPSLEIKVAGETTDYIVIDKPTGLVVHPAPGVHEATLVDWLTAHYPEITAVGEDKNRPGIVHRLDREVSGLLVVARTPEMFQHLKNQFKDRQVTKQYTALVVGQVSQASGTIDFPLARSARRQGKIAARPEASDDTREAVTHYEVAHQYQAVALLNVTIETGRTHQIRAHLAALGHSVVGDKLYRPARLSFKSTPGRLFLHASKLGFYDLANQWQQFFAPLPPELAQFLTTLA